MTWVKISDDWLEGDAIEALGAEPVVVHLSALSYCSRQRTDGHLPERALRRLWPAEDLDASVQTLEESGEWERTESGWFLTKWDEHLLSAEKLETMRKQSTKRSERFRLHRNGDHSECRVESCAVKREDASSTQSGTQSGTQSSTQSGTALVTSRSASSRLDAKHQRGDEDADALAADAERRLGIDSHGYRGEGLECQVCGLPPGNAIHAGTGLPTSDTSDR